MFLLLAFLVVAVLTILLAVRLSYYADQLSAVTGLGGGFVGLFLLSSITSLPELFSSGSAALWGNVDLAFGNVLGSNMTNMFLLFVLDLYMKREALWPKMGLMNTVTGSLVIAFQALVLLFVFLAESPLFANAYGVGSFAYLVVLVYFVCARVLYVTDKGAGQENPDSGGLGQGHVEKAVVLRRFVLCGLGVCCVSGLLSYVCDQLSAVKVGDLALGGTFVGTLLMALVTSLPELFVSLAALRLGAYEMAFGNIFGSNLFNLFILAPLEWFWRLGALFGFVENSASHGVFAEASQMHFISGFCGIIMFALVLLAVGLQSQRKIFGLSVVSVLLGIVYVLGLYVLFLYTRV